MFEWRREYESGDMTLLFARQKEVCAFTLVPSAIRSKVRTHRTALPETAATKAMACHAETGYA